MNDGVLWTDVHALLHLLEFRLRENTAVTAQAAGGKPKRQKFNPTPWKQPRNTVGNKGSATTEQVLAYLDSLKPKRN